MPTPKFSGYLSQTQLFVPFSRFAKKFGPTRAEFHAAGLMKTILRRFGAQEISTEGSRALVLFPASSYRRGIKIEKGKPRRSGSSEGGRVKRYGSRLEKGEREKRLDKISYAKSALLRTRASRGSCNYNCAHMCTCGCFRRYGSKSD